MNANRQLPFDVHDPEVQRACRAVARLLMDDAGDEEARRTVLAVMIAAMGDDRGRVTRTPASTLNAMARAPPLSRIR